MRIGIAFDHGGFELKQSLLEKLHTLGHEVVDFGAFSLTPEDDYPDFVLPLAEAVRDGAVERGIAVCGSGVGACIAANKVPHVRAALITEIYSAHQGVEHDDMNVICLGARVIGRELAQDLVCDFLAARFTGAERHQRRLAKVAAAEQGQAIAADRSPNSS
jgi:RpiB/LacA/LacB family sugar-phosphate isomerase